MNKTEIISEIIEALDKAERYDECEFLGVEETTLSEIDRNIMEVGRQKIMNDAVYSYWSDVQACKNDETGMVEVQPFEEWAAKTVRIIPDFISKRDFMAYFEKELRERYEEELALAVERLTE